MTDPATIAKKYGGTQIWTYSQSNWDTIKHTVWDSGTRWGICAALSAYWIARHANDGWLGTDLKGGNLGKLDHPLLKECARLHKQAGGNGAQKQLDHLTKWLKGQNVLRVNWNYATGSGRGFSGKQEIFAYNKPHSFKESADKGKKDPDIANKIVSKGLKNLRNHYGYLSFHGSALSVEAGHVTACWIAHSEKLGTGIALFFDPNYGEFYFEKKEHFFAFFRPFYHATYITKTMNFTKSFELVRFAKDAFCE